MSAADDLVSLFGKSDAPSPFRQGEVVTFDAATGANTVRVAGAILENLPILNSGDTVNLRGRVGNTPGDAVILLKYGSSWAILGRVIRPGGEKLSTVAVDFSAGGDSVIAPWTITSAHLTKGSVTIPTPPWANSLLLYAISTVCVSNPGAAAESVRVVTDLNGGGGGETIETVPTGGGFITTFAPVARHFGEGAGYPLTAATVVETRVRSNGANLNGQYTFLNYTATFRKV